MKSRKFVLSVTMLLVFIIVLSGCTSPTPSKFENLVTSATVDDEFYPINPTNTFEATTSKIYLTGNLIDATIDSVIIVEWYYLGGEEDLYLYQMSLEVTKTDMGFYFSLSKPTNDWFLGDYEILIFYDNDLMETVTFTIE
jgi:hypothetical protein